MRSVPGCSEAPLWGPKRLESAHRPRTLDSAQGATLVALAGALRQLESALPLAEARRGRTTLRSEARGGSSNAIRPQTATIIIIIIIIIIIVIIIIIIIIIRSKQVATCCRAALHRPGP